MKLHLPLLLAAAVLAACVSAPAFAESEYFYNRLAGNPDTYEIGGTNPLIKFSKDCANSGMTNAYKFLLISDVTTTGWDEPTSTSQYAAGRPLFWNGYLQEFTTHEGYTSAEGHTKASLSFTNCNAGIFGAGATDNPGSYDRGAAGKVTFDNLRRLEISGITASDKTETILATQRVLPGGIIYLERSEFENKLTITNVSDNNDSTYDVIFKNNSSDRGTIHADYVTLSENGGINFSGNKSLSDNGGAISATKEVSITNNTGEILFESNKTNLDGSAIYSADSILLGANQGSLIFKNNEGGSIINAQNDIVFRGNTGYSIHFAYNECIGHDSTGIHSKTGNILFESNQCDITITTNTHNGIYGAICATEGSVTLKENKGPISFNENTCNLYGAAIYAGSGVNFEGNNGVYFYKNASASTNGFGGAIYNQSGVVSFSDNEDVDFSYNKTRYTGGAIHAEGTGNNVSLIGNASVLFDHNEAMEQAGGAIYAGGSVTLSDNKREDSTSGKSGVSFTYNTAGTHGGAVYSDSTVSLTGNDDINFTSNTATTGRGGAIRGAKGITITGNTGNIAFTGNKAGTDGGAISHKDGEVETNTGYTTTKLSGNTGDISFIGNSAAGNGGAIALGFYGWLEIKDNTGTITFSGNTAGEIGGAIYCSNFYAPKGQSTVSIANNTGDVKFLNNRAGSQAGAIYVGGLSGITALDIRNNGNVLFEKNAVVNSSGNYLLRSIQYTDGGMEGGNVCLSAAAGKTIEFRDSIAGDFVLHVNEAYNGISQTGDIVLTGAYTEKHLNELMEADRVNRNATADEINASRQSTIERHVAVHGGRLRVEDGAVLSAYDIRMDENAGATLLVKNATVQCIKPNQDESYKGNGNIDITSGNTLQVEGASDIDDSVLFSFSLAEAVVVEGSLNATVGAILDTETLTLHSGSSLVLDKSHIDLDGGCLTLNMQGEDKINLVLTLDGKLMEDSIVNLFSDIGTLKLGSDLQYTSTDTFEFNASQYFTGSMIGEDTKVQFQNGSLTVTGLIPEPTTATLSLLALAAMATRRRRR